MKEIFETPRGTFSVDTAKDRKFAKLFREKVYQHDEDLEILKRHQLINTSSVVVDVGAHIGTTVIPFAKEVVHVHAFEPSPESAATLKENIKLNHLENVTVYQIGLSDHKGSAARVLPSGDNEATSMLVEGEGVAIDTLDNILHDTKVDFIKIDVEGMEPQVLKGAEKIIGQHKPVVLFEVNLTGLKQQKNRLSNIAAFFKKHEYTLFLPKDGHLEEVFGLSMVAALLQPRMFFFGQHSGVFNMLAVPKDRTLATIRIPFVSAFWLGWDLIKRIFRLGRYL